MGFLRSKWIELKQELGQVADEATKSTSILDRILAIWLLISFFLGLPMILLGYLLQSGDLLANGFGAWLLGWPWVVRDMYRRYIKKL